jgi:hypothetical protein
VDLHASRVFLHDTNGVPTLVDLAAMRDATAALGGEPARVNPVVPAELVVDHSVIADVFGTSDAFTRNVEIEYGRNAERYRFLRWGQQALRNFAVVPPGTGIMHQVNVEYLSRVVMADGVPTAEGGSVLWAYPDVCLGTDSHTTMVNGLGVLAWGIGVIDAEAAMLGQSLSMLLPRVVEVHLYDRADASPRRGRHVRRVLRPRRHRDHAGRPRDDQQHEPRVRLDLRLLPDRRRDAAVPALHRPQPRAGRAGRGLRQGAGPLARPRPSAAVLRAR